MLDRRFPTALHVMSSLMYMARQGSPWVSSAQFADYLQINATLVRRLLTALVQHGLLESQMGRNGGVRLARRPDEITLRDIYQASVADKKLWTSRTNIPARCLVSRNFERYFERLEADADLALGEMLAHRTLAEGFDVLEKMDFEVSNAQSLSVDKLEELT